MDTGLRQGESVDGGQSEWRCGDSLISALATAFEEDDDLLGVDPALGEGIAHVASEDWADVAVVDVDVHSVGNGARLDLDLVGLALCRLPGGVEGLRVHDVHGIG